MTSDGLANLPTDVRELLDRCVRGFRDLLGRDLVGVYAYGSLATGDFDPATSDLDLLVALRRDLDEGADDGLRRLMAGVVGTGGAWARRFEAGFLPVSLLRPAVPPVPARHAYVNTDNDTFWIGTDHLYEDWVLNRHTAWTGDLAFHGPSVRTLVDPATPDEIRSSVRRLLRTSWSEHVNGPDWMRPWKYQAFTVLTMCRALYALESGEIASKRRAAEWGIETLGAEWTPLIRRAASWRDDRGPDDLAGTLAFLRFSVGCAGPRSG